MRYKVILEESVEGFAVPDFTLPSCHSQGMTEQEALKNIANAIREYFAAVHDRLRGVDAREVKFEVSKFPSRRL